MFFGNSAPWYLGAGSVIGVLAGVMQFIGLVRWPFLVPALASRYADPQATQATRDAVATVFEAFHRFVGVALGEHLGYLFTAIWTLALSAAIIETGFLPPLIGWLGILVGTLEEAGWKPAGAINAIAYILWSAWLVAIGVLLLV